MIGEWSAARGRNTGDVDEPGGRARENKENMAKLADPLSLLNFKVGPSWIRLVCPAHPTNFPSYS